MAYRFLIVCGGAGRDLLGRRAELNLAAELHVDVSNELRRDKTDPCSFSLALDGALGTVQLLLAELRDRPAPGGPPISPYLETAIPPGPPRQHADMLIGKQLAGSLRQSIGLPALAGALIRHPANLVALQSRIASMLDVARQVNEGLSPGPENPIEVWIVSSTAGGAGAGTHRFVAAQFAQVLDPAEAGALHIHFARIGPLTYRPINHQRTVMASFIGIAADVACELELRSDLPFATTEWYYLDVPEVGINAAARERLIGIAVRSLMHRGLAPVLNELATRNSGLPMVPVSFGLWENSVVAAQSRADVLRCLDDQLAAILDPAPPPATGPLPQVRLPESIDAVSRSTTRDQVLAEMRRRWRFPKVVSAIPPSKLADRQHDFSDWLAAVTPLLGASLPAAIDIQLDPPPEPKGDWGAATGPFGAEWFRRVHSLRWLVALASALLEGRGGAWERTYAAARVCQEAQSGGGLLASAGAQATKLAAALAALVPLLAEVRGLQQLRKAAVEALKREAGEVQVLRDHIAAELRAAPLSGEAAVSECQRELHDAAPFGEQSILGWLVEGAQTSTREYHARVAALPAGMTPAGLARLLGLGPGADIQALTDLLRSQTGSWVTPDGRKLGGLWWQGFEPQAAQKKYERRLLPPLVPDLRSQFEKAATFGSFGFVFTERSEGFNEVVAIDAASLSSLPSPDHKATPTYLLQGLAPGFHELLHLRADLELAGAGVIGEPLHAQTLRDAGIDAEAVAYLAQLYVLC